MALAYTVRTIDRLLRFGTTNDNVVVTLLPFIQTPNAPYEIHKISTGDGHTVTIQVDPTTTDFLLPDGSSNITLDDAENTVYIKIPAGGLSPAFVAWGSSGGGGGTPPPPTGASVLFGTHAARPAPATVPDATIYVETDRNEVTYQSQAGVWHFLSGTMWNTISPDNRPTDLGVNDAGFDYRTTDLPARQFIWSGLAWVETTSTGLVQHGIHAIRPAPATVPDGAFYVETDRGGVIYQNWAGIWHYLAGIMPGTLSPDARPTDLGLNDGGFQYLSVDASTAFAPRTFTWSQTEWIETTGILYGTHAARPVANEKTPARTIYVETDRNGVIYQQQSNQWQFLAGTMWGTISPDNRPTDLGVLDAGFTYRTTDPPPRSFVWSGTAWVETTPPAAGSGGQNQTPWLSDIDGNQHNLYNVASIAINRTSGNSVLSITSDAADAPFIDYVRGPQTWWVGPGIEANPDFTFYNQTTSAVVMTVAANGNVGIGTAAPATELHVLSSATTQVTSECTDGPGYAQFRIKSDAGAYQFSVGGSATGLFAGACYIFDERASAPRLLIAPSGNVGINRPSPAYTLDVGGDIHSTNDVIIDSGSGLHAGNIDLGDYAGRGHDSNIGVYNGNLLLQYGGTGFTGNVGIGTVSPQSIFHVNYPGGFPHGPMFQGANQSCLQFLSASGGPGSGFAIGRSAIGNDAQDFWIYDGVAGAFRLQITSAGKVGIGTGNPNFRLTVHNPDTYVAVMITGSDTGAVGIGSYQGAGFIQAYPDSTASNGAPLTLQPSTGNVGIGTTGPRATLDIIVPSQTSNVADGGGGGLRLGVSSAQGATGLYFGVDDAAYAWLAVIAPGVGRYPLSLNPEGGNVGVGITNPAVTLSSGPLIAPIKVAAYDQGTASVNTYGMGVAPGMLTLGANIDPTSGTPQMTLSAGGRVGVGLGSATPTVQLSLLGGSPDPTTSLIPTTFADGAIELIDTQAAAGSGGEIIFSAKSGAWRMCAIKGYATYGSDNSQGDLVFYGRNAPTDAGLTEHMRIVGNGGNVGIGNPSPTHSLDVTGNFNCTLGANIGGVLGVGAGYTGIQPGDIGLGRPAAPTTGAIYFGNTGNHYIFFDGTSFHFNGAVNLDANATVSGQFAVHEGTDQYLFFVSQSGITSIVALNDALNAHVPLEYVASAHYFIGGNVGINTTGPTFPFEAHRISDAQYEVGLFQSVGAGCLVRFMDTAGLVTAFGSEQGVATIRTNNIDRLQITVDGVAAIPGGLVVGATGAGIAPGDICLARIATPSTGAIYFGNTGSHYIFWDGGTFDFTGPINTAGGAVFNGNVGISINPAFPLDVFSPNPGCQIRLGCTSNANNNTQLRFYGGKNVADIWAIGTDIASANGDKSFQFFDLGASKVPLYIQQATGFIGMGVIPTVKLDVVSNENTDSGGALKITSQNGSQNATYSFGGMTSSYYYRMKAGGGPLTLQESGGNVGIGTASPAAVLDVNGVMRCIGATAPSTGAGVEITYSSGWGFIQSYDRGAAAYHSLLIGGNPIELYGGNVGIGIGNPAYQLQLSTDSAAKPTTATWATPSGAGVKQNVKDLPGGLDVINRIRPIEAEYNGEHNTPKGQRVVSVIAEEIREVLPNTVTEDSDGVLGFNPHEIIFQLILAVKQLSKEADEWKRRFS